MSTICEVPVTEVGVGDVLVERWGSWPRTVIGVRPSAHEMIRLDLDDGSRTTRFKWETVHVRANA